MKTKTRKSIYEQREKLKKQCYERPNWCPELINRMVFIEQTALKYSQNINAHLGDFDIDDENEFYRRWELPMPRIIYAGY